MEYSLNLRIGEPISIWDLLEEHGIKKPIGTNLVAFSIKTYDSDCRIEYEGDYYEKSFTKVVKSKHYYKKDLRSRGDYKMLHAECLYLKADEPIKLTLLFE